MITSTPTETPVSLNNKVNLDMLGPWLLAVGLAGALLLITYIYSCIARARDARIDRNIIRLRALADRSSATTVTHQTNQQEQPERTNSEQMIAAEDGLVSTLKILPSDTNASFIDPNKRDLPTLLGMGYALNAIDKQDYYTTQIESKNNHWLP